MADAKTQASTASAPVDGNAVQNEGRALALALAYAPGDLAPKVVAKGKGLIAEEIIRRAREAGVFVHESPELVTLLMQSNLDDHIPPQLYVAIAELLAWIYKLEKGETES